MQARTTEIIRLRKTKAASGTLLLGISQMALRPRRSRGSHGDCIRCDALDKLNPGSGHRTITTAAVDMAGRGVGYSSRLGSPIRWHNKRVQRTPAAPLNLSVGYFSGRVNGQGTCFLPPNHGTPTARAGYGGGACFCFCPASTTAPAPEDRQGAKGKRRECGGFGDLGDAKASVVGLGRYGTPDAVRRVQIVVDVAAGRVTCGS